MPNNIFKTLILVISASFILTGCAYLQPVTKTADYLTGKVQVEQKKQADKTLATIACQALCQEKVLSNDFDISSGSCMSEKIIPDWVCDIAHSPRQPIDDDPRNQCASFRNGTTHHFVEVDGNCNVIKVE